MPRLAAVLAPLAVLALAAPAAAGAATWRLAREIPIAHKASVATFLDDQHGITAGYAGTKFFTADGGKTWQPGVNQSMCRYGVEAVPGLAVTAGNAGDVRVSTDGGAHWQRAASFGPGVPRHARFLSFLDAHRGVIGAQEELGITADGGQSWQKLASPPQGGIVAGVSLSEEGGRAVLRVLDEDGALWRSDDGGKTWAAAPSPLGKAVLESLGGPHAALRFVGTEGVLAAVVDAGGAAVGRVYRTRDGGKSWAEEEVAGLPASALTLSADGRLLTSLDAQAVRLYRME